MAARTSHEIVSSLSDDGSTIAFNYSRTLSGAPSTSDTIDDTEIYIGHLNPVLSLSADLKIRNLAAPVSALSSSTTAIAPDSLAVATAASNLARSTRQAARLPDDTFPLELEGATVTVNNQLAQMLFVSPTEIHFHVPAATAIGEATIVVNNGDGFETRGTITVAPAAPGIFTANGDGRGAGIILDADTLRSAPFDLSSVPDNGRRLILFATGARRAAEITITVANQTINANRIVDSPDFPGLDQIHFSLPANPVGAGTHSLVVTADNRRSNSVTLTLTGTAPSHIKRIEVSPVNSALEPGRTVQFSAKAFDSKDQLVPAATFQWSSSNTAVAEVSDSGLATARGIGAATITASAGSVRSTSVTLTVARPSLPVVNPTVPAVPTVPLIPTAPSVATYVEIAQLSGTLMIGESRQLTARIFDQTGRRITPALFVWSSSDASIATIDENGLVTTLRTGVVTITATNRNVTGALTLTISKPEVVINELLFDPADGAAGDANHDGVRNGTEDEFIELVNDSDKAVNIAGWTLRTRAANATTESIRHTFSSSAMIPMRTAVVIFGGGNFNPNNPVFGLAQVVKASSGGLLLANTSLTVVVRDAAGNLKAELPYGAGTDTPGGSSVNASLTRAPDVTGAFVAHTSLDPVNTPKILAGNSY